MELREIGWKYQRWVSKLTGYDFDVIYKPWAAKKVKNLLFVKFVGSIELNQMITCGAQWADIQLHIHGDLFSQHVA